MKNVKYISKERRETLSNRVVIQFGLLLCGALAMLYVYNFLNAGYTSSTITTCGVLAGVGLVAAIVFFVLGLTKCPKMKNWAGVFLGMFICGGAVFATKWVTAVSATKVVAGIFVLMLAYFVVLSIATAVYLKKHPEAPSAKNKIVHAKSDKKKNKKRK